MNELVIHPKLRCLDLFSGIGGISLGLRKWCQTVCYCEIDPYAAGVLIKNMAEGNLDVAPIWSDVTTLGASELAAIGPIDIIAGGFPCQDISYAGKGSGIVEGETRSGLFFEIMRIVDLVRPRFIFLENVPAVLTRGLGIILRELARLGYDAEWKCLSAAQVGANHRRLRWWCLAHAVGLRELQPQGCECDQWGWTSDSGADVAHPDCGRHLYRPLAIEPAERWFDALGQPEPGGADVDDAQGQRSQGQRPQRRNEIQPDGSGQVLAHPQRQSQRPGLCENEPGGIGRGRSGDGGGARDVADSKEPGLESPDATGKACPTRQFVQSTGDSWWATEPDVGRVAHGVQSRVDRLRCLGNSVVPQCVATVFPLLMSNL